MLSADQGANWVSLWGPPTSEPSPIEALGGDSGQPSWLRAAPHLAIDIVEHGRDEDDLDRKADELQGAGTAHFWAIRLAGPQRVVVYNGSASPKTFSIDRKLGAEGLLRRRLPLAALFDDEAAVEYLLGSRSAGV